MTRSRATLTGRGSPAVSCNGTPGRERFRSWWPRSARRWDGRMPGRPFSTGDIKALSGMGPRFAIAYVQEYFLDPADARHLRPAALSSWKQFLNTPESITAQRTYAEATVLLSAHHLAAKFMPEAATHTRVIAFFFDAVAQMCQRICSRLVSTSTLSDCARRGCRYSGTLESRPLNQASPGQISFRQWLLYS